MSAAASLVPAFLADAAEWEVRIAAAQHALNGFRAALQGCKQMAAANAGAGGAAAKPPASDKPQKSIGFALYSLLNLLVTSGGPAGVRNATLQTSPGFTTPESSPNPGGAVGSFDSGEDGG